jgi:TPR repeat protein
MGDIYGERGSSAYDDERSIEHYEKACRYGRGEACDRLARRYEEGDALSRDHAKAVTLLAQGCAAEDYQVWTCNTLRALVSKKDDHAVRAAEGWTKACSAGNAEACRAKERLERAK